MRGSVALGGGGARRERSRLLAAGKDCCATLRLRSPYPPSAACHRAIAANINRFVDKNGRISSFTPPPDSQPVHYLRGMLLGEQAGAVPVQVGRGALGPPRRPPPRSTPLLPLPCSRVQGSPQFVSQKLSRGEYPPPLQHMLQGPGGALPAGGQQLLLRSLSSSRLPYPALLLGRNAWTAVDLLYTLPGVPMTFGDERTGKAYRVDVTGTYAHNTAYLDNERKKREQRFAGQVRACARPRLPLHANPRHLSPPPTCPPRALRNEPSASAPRQATREAPHLRPCRQWLRRSRLSCHPPPLLAAAASSSPPATSRPLPKASPPEPRTRR